ncbi:MAG: aspartate kinase, partial [bacterium]
QNTAISFTICVNNDIMRIEKFLSSVGDTYLIEITDKLQLLTVFNPSADSNLSEIGIGKKQILEHRTKNALQVILQ